MITVLGDIIIDEYWAGNSTRLSPEAPVPVVTNIAKHQQAGGAANVALNINAMGSAVHLASQADSTFSVELLTGCSYHLVPSAIAPHKIRVIANDQVICRIDHEQHQPLAWDASWIHHNTKLCVLSDYNKGFLQDAASIIQHCNRVDIPTIVDPKKDWTEYSGCWMIKANRMEVEQQIGRTFQLDELKAICGQLGDEFNMQNIVVTLGADGLYAWDGSKGELMPCKASHVVDVTGAGDVVLAALAHYIAAGNDMFTAARKANQLAAISVSKPGAYVVTEDDMKSVEPKIVFTNGCFDVLHKGHIEYLRRSRELGTRLIVGLNSDRSVRELKGPTRPINSQEDRKALLESLSFVDEVIVFDEPTPRQLILEIKPHIITKGGDYTVDQVVGNDLVNQVVIIPLVEGYSTTGILERING